MLAQFALIGGENLVDPVVAQPLDTNEMKTKRMAQMIQVAAAPFDFSPKRSNDVGPSSARVRLIRKSAATAATGRYRDLLKELDQ